MEQEPFSIKVTISSTGEKKYRSRVEAQAAEGSNFGPGHEFEFDPDVGQGDVPSLADFVSWISSGTPPSAQRIESFGAWLFRSVFGEQVLEKFGELKGIARERSRPVRICLALHAAELGRVPWEFLHDGTNFLLKHGYSIVRVFDELVGAKSSFAPIRSLLIATADPEDPDYDRFDSERHVKEIKTLLGKSAPEATCRVVEHASRDDLLRAISAGAVDAFYFVGHGESSASGGMLICESNKKPERLDASDLAQALREARQIRFVYLNSCSTARVASKNPFQGVAQRLMLDGDVAAVAAMLTDVRQSAGLNMAKVFFENLGNKGPEAAMNVARHAANDIYSFGIPVLYSYLDAPRQATRNHLETFLRADTKSRFALVLPSFFLGRPAEKGQPAIPDDKEYRFPGETFAVADARSAQSVIDLLSPIVRPEQIGVHSLREGFPKNHTHYFLFGSKSNEIADEIRREFSSQFEFDYGEEWILHDKTYDQKYRIKAPHRQSERPYVASPDYGVIQRFQADNRVYFILAGLGSRATEGCGYYLSHHWQEHVIDTDFTVILKFPAFVDSGGVRVIDRKTGVPRDAATPVPSAGAQKEPG
jgi:hypothetical protein